MEISTETIVFYYKNTIAIIEFHLIDFLKYKTLNEHFKTDHE